MIVILMIQVIIMIIICIFYHSFIVLYNSNLLFLGNIVDLLLLPSNDGILSSAGFIDSLEFPLVNLPNGQSDYLAAVPSCSDTRNCPQIVWGFKTAGTKQ